MKIHFFYSIYHDTKFSITDEIFLSKIYLIYETLFLESEKFTWTEIIIAGWKKKVRREGKSFDNLEFVVHTSEFDYFVRKESIRGKVLEQLLGICLGDFFSYSITRFLHVSCNTSLKVKIWTYQQCRVCLTSLNVVLGLSKVKLDSNSLKS